jgi:hypothetical protein
MNSERFIARVKSNDRWFVLEHQRIGYPDWYQEGSVTNPVILNQKDAQAFIDIEKAKDPKITETDIMPESEWC